MAKDPSLHIAEVFTTMRALSGTDRKTVNEGIEAWKQIQSQRNLIKLVQGKLSERELLAWLKTDPQKIGAVLHAVAALLGEENFE